MCTMSQDPRIAAMTQDSEIENIEILIEYGHGAFEEDIASASANLALLQEQLAAAKQELEQLVNNRDRARAKYEKDLSIATTDLFNYLRNNEKTLIQVKMMEKRVKDRYAEMKAMGAPISPEIEKLASLLV
jgi:hypothetical protein